MFSSFVGRRLGKYEIVEIIAQGGMATVYKGYHREVDRYAAVKVLPPHPGRDPEFEERFRLEAHTIARLQHPNILPLYDFGVEDAILYLAMAFVDGGSLSDLITAGLPSLKHVERLLREVASALDYAHRRNVIHRDIKPANILLDSEGHALLADFGIAKIMDSGSNITGTGGIVGTPAYMAPEQSQAEAVDRRADIYSLGVVVYQMLTGEPPYVSKNPVQVMVKHVHDPIPMITQARKGLPPELDAVMQRVLAKTPDQRYQSVSDFYEAFSQIVYGALPLELSTASGKVTDTQEFDDLTPAIHATVVFESEDASLAAPTQPRIYTFLFTDIEGSTQRWERAPETMSTTLAQHDTMLSKTIAAYGGNIFKTVGDGVCAVFDEAMDAFQAAMTIQRRLFQAQDASLRTLKIRIGLYSGPAEVRANDYLGTSLSRTARLMDAAHGGQILLSTSTKDLLPPDVELRNLGMHRLKDVPEPIHVYQAVSSEFPLNSTPIRSLSPRLNNLPAQLTSFVGREDNVTEICRLMRQSNVRLLTLVGPGGIGKTRLSLQVGTNLLDEYEDGVFFVPLAPLSQEEGIIKFIAQALNLEEDSSTTLLETIRAHLRTRQALLIFDNFEHILDASPLVNDLLSAAPRLKTLVTSREPLFIYGEHTYNVPPLDLPESDEDVDQLLRSSAAKLFVERAQAMLPDFSLSETNILDVVKICQQLQGLPLALELAAARVRDLALSEIAEQLEQRLGLLSKGPRDLPARQQTIRGAIDWSYQLLSAEEQRIFTRLAVFEDRFFAQAAQAVADVDDLTVFQNKSLIQQPADQIYSMLEVLREFALEKLVSINELDTMRHKHGLYYCQWIESEQDHLTGRDQIAGFDGVKVEQYNVHSALEWFLQHEDFENAGRMVGVMWRYWATQSMLSEGLHWGKQVLAHADMLSILTHAKVTQGIGRLALLAHRYVESTALQTKSLELYQAIGDLPGQAAVLMSLGDTEYVQGNIVQAEIHLGASLSIFRELDDKAGVGRCLNNIGKIIMQRGEAASAEPLLRESLSLARENGSSEAIGLALYDLAGALRAQGNFQEAHTLYLESLGLYRELDFAVGIGTMLTNLGFTLRGMDNQTAALQHFLEGLNILQNLDEPVAVAECLIGIAGVLLDTDRQNLCVQTLGAANALLSAVDAQGLLDYVDQVEYERIYQAAGVESAQWQSAWDTGRSLSLKQIIKKVFEAA